MDRLETTLNELSVQHEELHQLPKFNQVRNNLKTYMDLDVAVAAVKDALVGHDTCAQAFERLYAQFKASSGKLYTWLQPILLILMDSFGTSYFSSPKE